MNKYARYETIISEQPPAGKIHRTSTAIDNKKTYNTIPVFEDCDDKSCTVVDIRFYHPNDFKFFTNTTGKHADSTAPKKTRTNNINNTLDLMEKRSRKHSSMWNAPDLDNQEDQDCHRMVKIRPSCGDYNDFDDPESMLAVIRIDTKPEVTVSNLSLSHAHIAVQV